MKRLAALVLLGSAACSEQQSVRIDGSSAQAFAVTTSAARRDLPIAERLIFDSAIATIPARRYADTDPAATARAAFDGMTAAEIVASERNRSPGESR